MARNLPPRRTFVTRAARRPALGVQQNRVVTIMGEADYTGSTLTASVFALTANGSATTTLEATVYRNGELSSGEVVEYTVERVQVGAAESVVSSSPTSIAADGVASSTITVTALASDRRALPGIPAASVVLASTGTGNTLTQPATATTATGSTSGSIVSTVAQTKTLSVTIAGQAITDTAPVVVGGGVLSPDFTDTFETGALAAAQNGYNWSGSNGASAINGTGANGSFTRTSGEWDVDAYVGVPVYFEDTSGGSPVPVGPFTVTSNTATVLSFTGDASAATRIRSTIPRVMTTEPYAGTYSLEFKYGPDQVAVTDYSFSEQDFEFGADLPEFWMEYYLYVPANYVHRNNVGSGDNNKFFLLAYADSTVAPDRMFIDLETDRNATTGGSSLFAQCNNSTDGSAISIPSPQTQVTDVISSTGVIVPGNWSRIRIHAAVASAAESNDGVLELWADNTLLFQKTDGRFWYPTGSSLYGTTPFFRNCYLQGFSNSGFTEETRLYIDNLKVYANDPEWTF